MSITLSVVASAVANPSMFMTSSQYTFECYSTTTLGGYFHTTKIGDVIVGYGYAQVFFLYLFVYGCESRFTSVAFRNEKPLKYLYELVFIDDVDTDILGLGQFHTRFRSNHQVIGLLRNLAQDFAT